MRRLISFYVGLAFVSCCASDAPAALITSSQNGTEFFDNFESEIAGDPVAVNGDWHRTENTPNTIVVTGSTTPPDPGPFEGSQYLFLSRLTSSGTDVNAVMENLVTSGTIHSEWMVYVPTDTTVDFAAEFSFLKIAPPPGGFITFPNDVVALADTLAPSSMTGIGQVIYFDPVSGNTSAGITYTAGLWQKWEFDLNLAAETYRLTVDGTSTADLPFVSGLGIGEGVSAAQIRGGNNGGSFFVDAVGTAVPEPSSLALLVMGTVSLLGYGWRRRGDFD